jgi:crossover junction endodeoxyribonuclease RuvC
MKALGIDPGTATTGYGILEGEGDDIKLVDYGCIKTSSKEPSSARLKKIFSDTKKIISKHKPKWIVVERLFFGANTKTAMAVGQARGVILLAASQAGLDIAEYTPLEVKMALTGYGRADKNQVQQMVKRILKLKTIPKPDDASDALAVALCHINSEGFNSKVRKAS